MQFLRNGPSLTLPWDTFQVIIKSKWINMLQKKLAKNKKPLTLSGEKMQQLLEDYWTANKNNRHKAEPFLTSGKCKSGSEKI